MFRLLKVMQSPTDQATDIEIFKYKYRQNKIIVIKQHHCLNRDRPLNTLTKTTIPDLQVQ